MTTLGGRPPVAPLADFRLIDAANGESWPMNTEFMEPGREKIPTASTGSPMWALTSSMYFWRYLSLRSAIALLRFGLVAVHVPRGPRPLVGHMSTDYSIAR